MVIDTSRSSKFKTVEFKTVNSHKYKYYVICFPQIRGRLYEDSFRIKVQAIVLYECVLHDRMMACSQGSPIKCQQQRLQN